MKLEVKDIPAKLIELLPRLRQYVVFIFILSVLGVYGFLVHQINTHSLAEPTEDALTEKLQDVRRPIIDETVLEHIRQLEDQNVEVRALFEEARNNPFSE